MDFRARSLGEICTRICSGGTPKSNISEYYNNGSIPWLNTKEVSFNRIRSTEKYITEEGLSNSSAKWISKNSVIVAMYGATAGKSAIAKIPLTTNQACCNLEVNPKVADYRYVYYWLKNHYEEILSLANGGAQQNLNARQIRSFTINLPLLENQKKIALILDSIDTKIGLNDHINDYLSELIKTLFRYWFVDFVPFKDEVKRTSEIGDIPASMELTPLAELTVTITKGTTPTTLGHQYVNAGVNFIKGESILDDYTFDHSKFAHIDEETNTALKRSIIQDRDLLFTIAGTLGRFAMAEPGMLPANTNQAVGIIRVDPVLLAPEVLLSYFIGGWQEDYYARRVQQAVQANLNLATLKSLPVPVLKDGRRLEYERQIIPLVNAIEANATESRTLKTLRDTLLPKLMSGEIDVSGLEIA